MRLKSILAIAFLLLSVQGMTQEALEPCRSVLGSDSLDLIVAARLMELLGLDRSPSESGGRPVARLIVQPTWQPESAVTVYMSDQGNAVVEAVEAESSISDANIEMIPVPHQQKPTFRYAPTADRNTVKVSRFRKELSRELASQISGVFARYIKNAKFPSDNNLRIVMDGTEYTFLTWVRGLGMLCATTSSPEDGTLPAELASLGRALSEYAQSNPAHSVSSLESIRKLVTKLMAKNASDQLAAPDRPPGGR